MRDPIRRRRGFMLVLSSPSGAGKTTLSRRVLEQNSDFVMSVSATTRAPRQGEVHGKDYYFVSPDEFEGMVQRGDFFEHATVFSHRYGSPHDPVMKALDAGKSVLFDIDWQGTQAISQRARERTLTMAKQLAFHQFFGNRRAIERHKIGVSTRRLIMQCLRDQLLAGAGFAVDHDRRRRICDGLDQLADLAHRLAVANNGTRLAHAVGVSSDVGGLEGLNAPAAAGSSSPMFLYWNIA